MFSDLKGKSSKYKLPFLAMFMCLVLVSSVTPTVADTEGEEYWAGAATGTGIVGAIVLAKAGLATCPVTTGIGCIVAITAVVAVGATILINSWASSVDVNRGFNRFPPNKDVPDYDGVNYIACDEGYKLYPIGSPDTGSSTDIVADTFGYNCTINEPQELYLERMVAQGVTEPTFVFSKLHITGNGYIMMRSYATHSTINPGISGNDPGGKNDRKGASGGGGGKFGFAGHEGGSKSYDDGGSSDGGAGGYGGGALSLIAENIIIDNADCNRNSGYYVDGYGANRENVFADYCDYKIIATGQDGEHGDSGDDVNPEGISGDWGGGGAGGGGAGSGGIVFLQAMYMDIADDINFALWRGIEGSGGEGYDESDIGFEGEDGGDGGYGGAGDPGMIRIEYLATIDGEEFGECTGCTPDNYEVSSGGYIEGVVEMAPLELLDLPEDHYLKELFEINRVINLLAERQDLCSSIGEPIISFGTETGDVTFYNSGFVDAPTVYSRVAPATECSNAGDECVLFKDEEGTVLMAIGDANPEDAALKKLVLLGGNPVDNTQVVNPNTRTLFNSDYRDRPAIYLRGDLTMFGLPPSEFFGDRISNPFLVNNPDNPNFIFGSKDKETDTRINSAFLDGDGNLVTATCVGEAEDFDDYQISSSPEDTTTFD